MIFGFDIDGVLYDWHRISWEWFCREMDSNISFDDFWKPHGYVHKNEGSVLIENMVKLPTLYNKELIPKSRVDALWKLSKIFDTFYYITNRPAYVQVETSQLLFGSDVPYPLNLLFVKGHKADAVESLGCEYFVEDKPRNIENLVGVVKNLYIVDQPYNKHVTQGIRIHSVVELPQLIL